MNWRREGEFWADCGYVCGEALLEGGRCLARIIPYLPQSCPEKIFQDAIEFSFLFMKYGSLGWRFSFLRLARNNFDFHFCKTAGQSGCPFSFSFAMAAKPIYLYCTLLDMAANIYLYAMGKFDKIYPYRIQLEKNPCDIAFCYIFIPKCDIAKWHIVVRACLLRSVACAPSLRARRLLAQPSRSKRR